MKFRIAACCILISLSAHAQQNTPYLIPRQIFVGDPAVLVVPLTSTTTSNITLTADLPFHNYIDFHKITLHGDRLLIEFTAFAPGEHELPLIEIGGHYFPNLRISVGSLIDRRSAITLSSPASSLAMPGTAIMLYGTMAGILVIIFTFVWFFVKGKKIFAAWKEKWKRWRLFTNMRQTERRLNKAVLKGAEKRMLLNKLSDEFRNFLSVLTSQNCRAMTATELGNLQPAKAIPQNVLKNFFTLCDNYRFSGTNASNEDLLGLLKDLRKFVDEAEQLQKEVAA